MARGNAPHNRLYVAGKDGIWIGDSETKDVVRLWDIRDAHMQISWDRPFPEWELRLECERANIDELTQIYETMKYDTEDASNGAIRLRNRIRLEGTHTPG